MFRPLSERMVQLRHTEVCRLSKKGPVSRALTPQESATLTAERRRLERENAQLREQVRQHENLPAAMGNESLARFARGIKFAGPSKAVTFPTPSR